MNERELIKSEKALVKKLIRRECCNYDEGSCVVAFDGEDHTCPQMTSLGLICRWFIEAVLPLDKQLQKRLQKTANIQTTCCEICGKEIVKHSNRTKYCNQCAVKIRRRKKAAHMARKRRMKVDV